MREPCATHPPAGHRIPVGGWVYCRESSPTHQQGNTPARGVALVHGGQRPIPPQSKTNFLPPPATQYVFDCGDRNALIWWSMDALLAPSGALIVMIC